MMALDLIDEDSHQVRKSFDISSLRELASTIATRGVKTPISIRPHPGHKGRYVINHGARRYRASLIAGKTEIPVYIDPDYTRDDQAIENLQRDSLLPREIAEFIDRRLKEGAKKQEVAKSIGKSNGFVTKHLALLDLPAPIATAFRNGVLNDVELIYQLSVLHARAPDDVSDWIAYNNANLSRDSLKKLHQEIERRGGSAPEPVRVPAGESGPVPDRSANQDGQLRQPRLIVESGSGTGELLFRRRPTDAAHAWVRMIDGSEFEVMVHTLRLIALEDGRSE